MVLTVGSTIQQITMHVLKFLKNFMGACPFGVTLLLTLTLVCVWG